VDDAYKLSFSFLDTRAETVPDSSEESLSSAARKTRPTPHSNQHQSIDHKAVRMTQAAHTQFSCVRTSDFVPK
jgi:hypothetical protein